jgi:hypothetical protein
MSGLMKLLGALLLAAAIAFVLLLKLSSAQMQVWGISPDVIATLLVGGVLSLGLAGVIDAVSRGGLGAMVQAPTPMAKVTIDEPVVDEKVAGLPRMGFGKKRAETPSAQEAVAAVAPVATAVAANSVADTIAALEQAKSDIKTALGGVESMTAPIDTPAPAAAPVLAETIEAEAAPASDGEELYVVEEKIIRGRPSRILSDDTVEAETDEGWMRFENLEHLNEYLDSVEDANA